MNMSQISGLLRTVLTIAGTYLVSTGHVSAGDMEAIVGAVMVLVSVAATTYTNRATGLVKAATKLDEVVSIKVDRDSAPAKVAEKTTKVLTR